MILRIIFFILLLVPSVSCWSQGVIIFQSEFSDSNFTELYISIDNEALDHSRKINSKQYGRKKSLKTDYLKVRKLDWWNVKSFLLLNIDKSAINGTEGLNTLDVIFRVSSYDMNTKFVWAYNQFRVNKGIYEYFKGLKEYMKKGGVDINGQLYKKVNEIVDKFS